MFLHDYHLACEIFTVSILALKSFFDAFKFIFLKDYSTHEAANSHKAPVYIHLLMSLLSTVKTQTLTEDTFKRL